MPHARVVPASNGEHILSTLLSEGLSPKVARRQEEEPSMRVLHPQSRESPEWFDSDARCLRATLPLSRATIQYHTETK